jgi:hypothetical protein
MLYETASVHSEKALKRMLRSRLSGGATNPEAKIPKVKMQAR